MPRWGEIFGGALSGAGGLMSELAMRRMEQEDDLEIQEQGFSQRGREALATAFTNAGTNVRTGDQTVQQANSNLAQLAQVLGVGENIPSFDPLPIAENTVNAVRLAGEGGSDSVLAQLQRLTPDEPGVSLDIEGPPINIISEAMRAPEREADFKRRQERTAIDVPAEGGGTERLVVDGNGNPVYLFDDVPLDEGGSARARRDPIRTSPSIQQQVDEILGVEADPRIRQLRESQAGDVSRGGATGQFEAALSDIGKAALDAGAQRSSNAVIAQGRANFQLDIEHSGLSPQQQTVALSLADDFYRESGDFFAIDASFRRLSALANNPSPVSDVGLVFSLMKMFDPASTVREGEQAQARNTIRIPDRVWQTYNRLFVTGESLEAGQREDFLESARNIYAATSAPHLVRVKSFEDRARSMRVPNPVIDTLFRGTEDMPSNESQRSALTWAKLVSEADKSQTVALMLEASNNLSSVEDQQEFAAELQRLGITVEAR